MSMNSKAKRDKKKKHKHRQGMKTYRPETPKLGFEQVQELLRKWHSEWALLFNGMTMPSDLSEDIRTFCASFSLSEPLYLPCEPESWSRQSCCDLNVKKYVEQIGGEMLCGYRIWAAGSRYVEAERHAVWTDGKTIRDVSFVDTGEERTLFVPDSAGSKLRFEDVPAKIRHAFSKEDKKLVEAFESMQPPIQRMSDDEAWETMLTFERWQSGERMANIIATTVTS